MRIQQKEQEALAQKFESDRLLSIAANERLQAEEFAKADDARQKQVSVEVMMIQARAFLTLAERWDGQSMPKFISSGGNVPDMLLGVGSVDQP